MLEGLRELGWKKITKCFALFPAVEKMAETPQGILLRFFNYFNFLTRFIMFFLENLSRSFKQKVCTHFVGGQSIKSNNLLNKDEANFMLEKKIAPQCIVDAAVELVRTDVVSNIIHMLNHELNTVRVFLLAKFICQQLIRTLVLVLKLNQNTFFFKFFNKYNKHNKS